MAMGGIKHICFSPSLVMGGIAVHGALRLIIHRNSGFVYLFLKTHKQGRLLQFESGKVRCEWVG